MRICKTTKILGDVSTVKSAFAVYGRPKDESLAFMRTYNVKYHLGSQHALKYLRNEMESGEINLTNEQIMNYQFEMTIDNSDQQHPKMYATMYKK